MLLSVPSAAAFGVRNPTRPIAVECACKNEVTDQPGVHTHVPVTDANNLSIALTSAQYRRISWGIPDPRGVDLSSASIGPVVEHLHLSIDQGSAHVTVDCHQAKVPFPGVW